MPVNPFDPTKPRVFVVLHDLENTLDAKLCESVGSVSLLLEELANTAIDVAQAGLVNQETRAQDLFTYQVFYNNATRYGCLDAVCRAVGHAIEDSLVSDLPPLEAEVTDALVGVEYLVKDATPRCYRVVHSFGEMIEELLPGS